MEQPPSWKENEHALFQHLQEGDMALDKLHYRPKFHTNYAAPCPSHLEDKTLQGETVHGWVLVAPDVWVRRDRMWLYKKKMELDERDAMERKRKVEESRRRRIRELVGVLKDRVKVLSKMKPQMRERVSRREREDTNRVKIAGRIVDEVGKNPYTRHVAHVFESNLGYLDAMHDMNEKGGQQEDDELPAWVSPEDVLSYMFPEDGPTPENSPQKPKQQTDDGTKKVQITGETKTGAVVLEEEPEYVPPKEPSLLDRWKKMVEEEEKSGKFKKTNDAAMATQRRRISRLLAGPENGSTGIRNPLFGSPTPSFPEVIIARYEIEPGSGVFVVKAQVSPTAIVVRIDNTSFHKTWVELNCNIISNASVTPVAEGAIEVKPKVYVFCIQAQNSDTLLALTRNPQAEIMVTTVLASLTQEPKPKDTSHHDELEISGTAAGVIPLGSPMQIDVPASGGEPPTVLSPKSVGVEHLGSGKQPALPLLDTDAVGHGGGKKSPSNSTLIAAGGGGARSRQNSINPPPGGDMVLQNVTSTGGLLNFSFLSHDYDEASAGLLSPSEGRRINALSQSLSKPSARSLKPAAINTTTAAAKPPELSPSQLAAKMKQYLGSNFWGEQQGQTGGSSLLVLESAGKSFAGSSGADQMTRSRMEQSTMVKSVDSVTVPVKVVADLKKKGGKKKKKKENGDGSGEEGGKKPARVPTAPARRPNRNVGQDTSPTRVAGGKPPSGGKPQRVSSPAKGYPKAIPKPPTTGGGSGGGRPKTAAVPAAMSTSSVVDVSPTPMVVTIVPNNTNNSNNVAPLAGTPDTLFEIAITKPPESVPPPIPPPPDTNVTLPKDPSVQNTPAQDPLEVSHASTSLEDMFDPTLRGEDLHNMEAGTRPTSAVAAQGRHSLTGSSLEGGGGSRRSMRGPTPQSAGGGDRNSPLSEVSASSSHQWAAVPEPIIINDGRSTSVDTSRPGSLPASRPASAQRQIPLDGRETPGQQQPGSGSAGSRLSSSRPATGSRAASQGGLGGALEDRVDDVKIEFEERLPTPTSPDLGGTQVYPSPDVIPAIQIGSSRKSSSTAEELQQQNSENATPLKNVMSRAWIKERSSGITLPLYLEIQPDGMYVLRPSDKGPLVIKTHSTRSALAALSQLCVVKIYNSNYEQLWIDDTLTVADCFGYGFTLLTITDDVYSVRLPPTARNSTAGADSDSTPHQQQQHTPTTTVTACPGHDFADELVDVPDVDEENGGGVPPQACAICGEGIYGFAIKCKHCGAAACENCRVVKPLMTKPTTMELPNENPDLDAEVADTIRKLEDVFQTQGTDVDDGVDEDVAKKYGSMADNEFLERILQQVRDQKAQKQKDQEKKLHDNQMGGDYFKRRVSSAKGFQNGNNGKNYVVVHTTRLHSAKARTELHTAIVHRQHLVRRVLQSAYRRYQMQGDPSLNSSSGGGTDLLNSPRGGNSPKNGQQERQPLEQDYLHSVPTQVRESLLIEGTGSALQQQQSSQQQQPTIIRGSRKPLRPTTNTTNTTIRSTVNGAALPFDHWKYITREELLYLKVCTERIRAMVVLQNKLRKEQELRSMAQFGGGPNSHIFHVPQTAMGSRGSIPYGRSAYTGVPTAPRRTGGSIDNNTTTNNTSGRRVQSARRHRQLVGLLQPLVPQPDPERPFDEGEKYITNVAKSLSGRVNYF